MNWWTQHVICCRPNIKNMDAIREIIPSATISRKLCCLQGGYRAGATFTVSAKTAVMLLDLYNAQVCCCQNHYAFFFKPQPSGYDLLVLVFSTITDALESYPLCSKFASPRHCFRQIYPLSSYFTCHCLSSLHANVWLSDRLMSGYLKRKMYSC